MSKNYVCSLILQSHDTTMILIESELFEDDWDDCHTVIVNVQKIVLVYLEAVMVTNSGL